MGTLSLILISLCLCLAPNVIHCVEVQLTTLNNYPFGSMYQYQARCSIPCSGSYEPGDLQITVTFDKAVYNLYTFGHFFTEQESPRRSWEILSNTWLHANSRGLCEFDVQVDHTQGNLAPSGSCSMGWAQPVCGDTTGRLSNGLTCEEISYYQLHECYNSTVSTQCCYTCTKFRMDLPNPCCYREMRRGGYRHTASSVSETRCTNISSKCPVWFWGVRSGTRNGTTAHPLHDRRDCEYGDRSSCNISDHECYDRNTNTRCCMTCHDTRQTLQGEYGIIPNCPYGNRLPARQCAAIERKDCYAMDQDCCETCFWMAEEEYPDCRYGNRRQCSNILRRDCYNSTIALECCEWCHDLKDEEHQDCQYGDRAQKCSQIDRSDCYESETNTRCCSTCREYANPEFKGCEYGDKGNCDEATTSNCTSFPSLQNLCCEKCQFLIQNNCPNEDQGYCYDGILFRDECYDTSTRRDCCNTCYDHYDGSLADLDCSFGDRDTECWYSTLAEYCYDKTVERQCCETCASFYRENLAEDCKFGDRTPSECFSFSGIECYDSGKARDCCEECSYWEIPDSPDQCKYGDRSEDCYRIAPNECYETDTERECCNSCPDYNQQQQYGYDCRYGDKNDDCYRSPYRECYEAGFRTDCCRYCNESATSAVAGCMYGDKSERCDNMDAGDCYELEDTCCNSCPYLALHIVIDDCKYGNRKDNCSDIQASDCYDSDVARQCCLTCYYLQGTSPQNDCPFGDKATDCQTIRPHDCYVRQNDCCETCKNHVIEDHEHIDDCDYGDRSTTCNNIEDRQCYNMNRERECCETCYNRRDLTTDAADCLYGDRVESCSDAMFHGSECYNLTRRSMCCETCENLKTDSPNCVYGDKKPVCQTIQPGSTNLCYTLHTACCQTCPQYRNDNSPECEYGDAIPDCFETECARYSAYDLKRCCSTCNNYITRAVTDPTTTTTSTTSTTPVYSTEVTQTPDKQTGTTSASTPRPTVTKLPTRPNNTWTPSDKTDRETTSLSATTTVAMETEKSDLQQITDALASIGPIVGGAVGGVLVIVVIVGVACYFMRRSRAEKPLPRPRGLHAQPIRSAVSYSNNHNPPPQPGPPSQRPTLKRQHTKDEVYDYIHPDDVKSVVSEPNFRPELPDRDLPDQGYLEPRGSVATDYSNRGYLKDSLSGDHHTYHILQKDDGASDHHYTSM